MADTTSQAIAVKRGVTAAQRALALPEILSNIFNQKARNGKYAIHTKYEERDLFQFALVNSYWYAEAVRVLWAHPMTPIDKVMARVPADRRQFYANFVLWAQVLRQSRTQRDSFAEGGSLYGITFPRLGRIFVSIFTTDFFVIPIHHPHDWACEMYFKKRKPKSDDESSLDSIFRVISKFLPGADELYLRYEGPVSNLSGLVEAKKKGCELPAEDTHWYIDPCPATVPKKNELFFEEEQTEVEVYVDTWGESTWNGPPLVLGSFNVETFTLNASSLSAMLSAGH